MRGSGPRAGAGAPDRRVSRLAHGTRCRTSISTTTRPRRSTSACSRRCCRFCASSMATRRAGTSSAPWRARRSTARASRWRRWSACSPSQVVFTSGGTEANNLFIKGAAAMLQAVADRGQRDRASRASPSPRRNSRARAGRCASSRSTPTACVDLADVDAALAEPTGIVSVMLANNETGVIQPVAAIAEQARAAKAWMHTRRGAGAGQDPGRFRGARACMR